MRGEIKLIEKPISYRYIKIS